MMSDTECGIQFTKKQAEHVGFVLEYALSHINLAGGSATSCKSPQPQSSSSKDHEILKSLRPGSPSQRSELSQDSDLTIFLKLKLDRRHLRPNQKGSKLKDKTRLRLIVQLDS